MTDNFWRYFWAPAAWAAILFIQSSIPDVDPPFRLSRWDDKWAHVLIYAPLGFLVLRALHQARPQKPKTVLFWLAVLLGCAYGVSDEIHQHFVPGRSCDWRDGIADGLGVLAGALFYLYLLKKKNAPRAAPQKAKRPHPKIEPEKL